IKTRDNAEQKTMQNSFRQTQNLDGVFRVDKRVRPEPVFLVDDMIDSRWTMTVLAALLRQHGCRAVFPLALTLNSLG
ncbi:ATP-dependent DNA helicase RecG, partial [Calditrichota bacterium]